MKDSEKFIRSIRWDKMPRRGSLFPMPQALSSFCGFSVPDPDYDESEDDEEDDDDENAEWD